MEENQSSEERCGSLNQTQLRMITLAMTAGGGIGVTLTAATLIALILAKAYGSVLQRLCLWAVIATLVHLLTHLASIEQYFEYRQQEEVCAILGFTHNLSAWCEQVFFLDIALYLLILVYMQVRGSAWGFTQRRCLRVMVEIVTVLLSILLPASLLWVPYYQGYYGVTAGYCWIRHYLQDCNGVPLHYTMIYGYLLYEIVGGIALCICCAILIVYCSLSSLIQTAKTVIQRIVVLLLAIIISVLCIDLLILTTAKLVHGEHYQLKMAFALIATCNDLILLFGYLLAFHSSTFCRFFKKIADIGRRNGEGAHTRGFKTIRESERVSAPSSTFFEVEYTGDFTDVRYLLS
jgi:hypothetical protein